MNYNQPGYGQPYQVSAPPVSTGDWFLTMLLMCIPFINIILLFVWAFSGGTNPSKSNWAKATLIWMLIAFVLWAIIMGISLLIAAISQANY
ncbi:MAG: hypothetical protein PHV06_03500 [bacterium]|nr:hypothetical protein [bacterium]